MVIRSHYPDVAIPEVSLADFLLADIGGKYEDYVALVSAETGKEYTFNEVRFYVRRVASALTRLGFGKGDVFCIYCPNIPEFALMFLGVLAVGGVVTTANPMYRHDELIPQLKNTAAQYIITFEDAVPIAQQAASEVGLKAVYVFGEAPGCRSFSELLADDGSMCPKYVPVNPKEDVAILPSSSGTTGLPKAVMLTHYNVVGNLIQMRELVYRGKPGDALMGALPFFHSFGMLVIMLGGIKYKQKVVCISQFNPLLFLESIQKYRVRMLPCVPPMALLLAKHPIVDNYDLSCLEDILCAAAPLGVETERELKKRFNTEVGQGYGLTETSPCVSASPPTDRHPGASGVLMPNTECKVVDIETGKELGQDQDGELWFRGPQVMKGYLNNPQATAATVDKDGWLHTGDIGHYDSGHQLYIVERLKELIKYKGFQVPPAELEAVLLSHPAILDAAVVGIPDQEAGELPFAMVILKEGKKATKKEVADFVAGKLAPYKRLRGGVEFVDEIPKSASGKILRRLIRDEIAKRRTKSKL
ncbi:4-coumarate--CoA ligase 1 [Lingula anatina]|uniref:Luciferin 4-monooxygenase n=1 Tax=Lingula anatina TaxID=7574 RepID=A0A1S3K6B0_LINAN|nr:4-coumarate--CoA ligase 1 [Lingula anatina]|eukprot:XP_013418047.1 4-coumarate--CoA ligase 1 [Lingula anatina]